MSVDRKSLCPNCGAPLSGLEIKCPECGYVLTSETSASKGTTESLLSLQEKLLAVDKVFSLERSSKKKASIINTFPIPNTAEALIRLLHFSYSNFEAARESGDKRISMAWLGKASESFRRLSEYKEDKQVQGVLEQYKSLGENNAFAKLSGSRKKKRIIAFSFIFILVLIAIFAILFDWEAYIIKRGKVEELVSFYSRRGKSDRAIELLIDNELYSKAAELLSSRGETIRAACLLAQEGLVSQSLEMVGRLNSSDSIHCCINELSDYIVLDRRVKYFLESNIVYLGDDSFTELYDHSPRKRKASYLVKDSTLIWKDYLNVMRDIDYPEPYYRIVSPFWHMYVTTQNLDQDEMADISRNNLKKVSHINFFGGKYVSDFTYGRDGLLLRESLLYSGLPAIEVKYNYAGGKLLDSFHCAYLIGNEMIQSPQDSLILEHRYGLLSAGSSYTCKLLYDNGQLSEIQRIIDDGSVLYDTMVFEYFGNMRLITTLTRDINSNRMIADNRKTVQYFVGGNIVEEFDISLQGSGNGLQTDIIAKVQSDKTGEVTTCDENGRMSEIPEEHVVSDDQMTPDKTANVPSKPEDLPEQRNETVTKGSVSVTAPNWVQVGERFSVAFSFEDKVSDFEFTNPDGILLVWGPQKSTSTSSVEGNSVTVTTYTFVLSAQAPGIYSLPAKAKSHDHDVQFPKISVEVVK